MIFSIQRRSSLPQSWHWDTGNSVFINSFCSKRHFEGGFPCSIINEGQHRQDPDLLKVT